MAEANPPTPRSLAYPEPWAPADWAADPDHHLWRNGRLWWAAFTVHLPGWQKERVRVSLGTADLAEARRRRDQLLARYPSVRPCTLSLRPGRRRRSVRTRPPQSGMQAKAGTEAAA